MNHCDWLPDRARWPFGSAVRRKIVFLFLKSSIDQVFMVKMAGYWSYSILCYIMSIAFFFIKSRHITLRPVSTISEDFNKTQNCLKLKCNFLELLKTWFLSKNSTTNNRCARLRLVAFSGFSPGSPVFLPPCHKIQHSQKGLHENQPRLSCLTL